MLKNFLKIRERKGTALITALLVMGVLTAISLAVSTLIVREINITRLAIDAGKAYYAAESGIEEALLKLEKGEEADAGANYTIKNTAKTYPVMEEDMESDYPEAYYSYLDVNESVTIPLFTSEDEKVLDFVVQYYIDLKKGDFIFRDTSILNGWDVLRWKIYGIVPEGENKGKTESINDFTSVALIQDGESARSLTKAAMPSWFGTYRDWNSTRRGDFNFFTMDGDIGYADYGKWDVTWDVLDDGQVVYQGNCPQDHAREHYKYDGDIVTVMDCYPIKDFLENHSNNYLVLTNLMNPSVLSDTVFEGKDDRERNSRLYYRVVSLEDMPREFADITATGESGDSKITLNMLRKRDSFMPVFNFALYHTGN